VVADLAWAQTLRTTGWHRSTSLRTMTPCPMSCPLREVRAPRTWAHAFAVRRPSAYAPQ